MRKIAVVLFALAVMCVSGEPPAGKQNQCYTIGSIKSAGNPDWEKFEVYEDWDRGYLVYKQVNYLNTAGGERVLDISLIAVPIRADWPPKQTAEEVK